MHMTRDTNPVETGHDFSSASSRFPFRHTALFGGLFLLQVAACSPQLQGTARHMGCDITDPCIVRLSTMLCTANICLHLRMPRIIAYEVFLAGMSYTVYHRKQCRPGNLGELVYVSGHPGSTPQTLFRGEEPLYHRIAVSYRATTHHGAC